MNDVPEKEVIEAPKPSGLATASMVLGISSILFLPLSCVFGPTPLLLFLFAIIGLILGLMSKKAANKGQALAGIITSGCAIVVMLCLMVVTGLFLTAFTSLVEEDGGVMFPFPFVLDEDVFDEEGMEEWIESLEDQILELEDR